MRNRRTPSVSSSLAPGTTIHVRHETGEVDGTSDYSLMVRRTRESGLKERDRRSRVTCPYGKSVRAIVVEPMACAVPPPEHRDVVREENTWDGTFSFVECIATLPSVTSHRTSVISRWDLCPSALPGSCARGSLAGSPALGSLPDSALGWYLSAETWGPRCRSGS